MNINTLKIIVILALLMVIAQAKAEPNETPATQPNVSTGQYPGNLFSSDANFTFGKDNQFNTGTMFWRMMLAVLLVAALGGTLYYVCKKFSTKITGLQPGRRIQVLETAYLGSRKTIHLLKVDNRKILIGTTQTTITPITDLGEGPPAGKDQQHQTNVG